MQDRLSLHRLSKTRKSILLLGPRQVGKSTLSRRLQPDVLINLMDERNYLMYAKDPARLLRELRTHTGDNLIVIDEIQRIPALLNTLQVLMDDPTCSLRFLLTGSSARKLKRGGANLLPGRIILERLPPFSYLEVAERFDLEQALQFGMLPGIYLEADNDTRCAILESYVEIYLREEIQAEALVKGIGSYARFVDAIAVTSGQWLNYTKLSSDTEIPKETLRRYVEVLEDTLVAHRIPAYQPRGRVNRRVAQRDRILLFDVGIRNALLKTHRLPVTPDQYGPVFEQWVILQVIALQQLLRKNWSLSSYRSHGGAEVDLVLEYPGHTLGIEIKASRNVGPSDFRGLQSLAELIPPKRKFQAWIIYLGESPQQFDGPMEVLPFTQALHRLAEL